MTAAKPPERVTLYAGPTYEGREALWSEDGETAYLRVDNTDQQLIKDLADGWRQSMTREGALRSLVSEAKQMGWCSPGWDAEADAALAATKEEKSE
jgi:hypothetical protein